MTDTSRDLRSHFGLTTIPFTREIAVEDRWSAPLFDEPLAALRSTDGPPAGTRPRPAGRFALVVVDPRCSGCNVCAELCPTRAMVRREDADGTVTIEVRDGLCTGCGVCVRACGPRAIRVEPVADVPCLRAERPRSLARVPLQRCPACGVSSPGFPGACRCPVCERRSPSGTATAG